MDPLEPRLVRENFLYLDAPRNCIFVIQVVMGFGLVNLWAMNSTFFMCKPDAVERGLIGEIIRRIEATGLKIVRAELRVVDEATAKAHYAEHEGKPFFGELISFITSSPVFVTEISGPDGTWEIVRKLMGKTNPAEAAPGTIRGDLATSISANLVHGSDSADSARRELANFFPVR